MEIIDRYVYAVIKRLPAKQREEVKMELEGLIEDMVSDRFRFPRPSETEVAEVLLQLGEPSKLAEKFRGKKRYLISPESFDTYLLVLKIVIGVITLGITIALSVEYIVNPTANVFTALGNYISSVITAIAYGFAWVTVIFAIFEHVNFDVKELREDFADNKRWSPSDLPKIPEKTGLIKPSEPIFGIVGTIFFIIVFNFAAHLIGAFIIENDRIINVIPVFNIDVLKGVLPLLNAVFFLAILKESLKLIMGKWTIALGVASVVLNIISLVFIMAVFTDYNIFSSELVVYLMQLGVLPANLDINLTLSQFTRVLTGIITIVYLLDALLSLLKGIKHRG